MEKKTLYTIPAKGLFLVSEPSLNDQYFGKSVVLLAEHNTEGSFGLVINRPSEFYLDQVVKDFHDINPRIFIGGPVNVDSLFYIHTQGDIEGSIPILKGLYWGGNIDIVKEMLLNGKISEKEIRFYIGYSGWSPQQLERELKEKSWVLMDASISQVFSDHQRGLWRQLIQSSGDDHALWINYPEEPEWN